MNILVGDLNFRIGLLIIISTLFVQACLQFYLFLCGRFWSITIFMSLQYYWGRIDHLWLVPSYLGSLPRKPSTNQHSLRQWSRASSLWWSINHKDCKCFFWIFCLIPAATRYATWTILFYELHGINIEQIC